MISSREAKDFSFRAKIGLNMRIPRPKGRRRRPNDANRYREPSYPLRERDASGAAKNCMRMFTLNKYVRRYYPGYLEELPDYLLYLFGKYAYTAGAFTSYAVVLHSDNDFATPPRYRSPGVLEPADMIYLSDPLIENLCDGSEEANNLYDLVYHMDPTYANAHMEEFVDRMIGTREFLLEMVPRMYSRTAVQLYEEHLENWKIIVSSFSGMIEDFALHVRFTTPLRSFKKRILTSIANQDLRRRRQRGTTTATATTTTTTTAITTEEPTSNPTNFVLNVVRCFGDTLIDLTNEDGETEREAVTEEQEEEKERKSLCTICMCNDRTVLFMPCKHCVCCRSCADIWLEENHICPFCRTDVDMDIDFFLP